ncbi:MAG: hypothetical protein R2707_06615 [Acidimicrobiales bacterium]
MSTPRAPLRIEIVDPVHHPLDAGWMGHAAVASPSPGIEEWGRSLADAGAGVRRLTAPLARRVDRAGAAIRRTARVAHERSLQTRADGNPRRASAVRQHVFVGFDTVVERLAAVGDGVVTQPGVTVDFSSGFAPLPGGGHRAEASLGLRGSWPRLPVAIRVEPWWREQSIVTVELRTRRRVRYPRRYFRGAHAAARAIGRALAD